MPIRDKCMANWQCISKTIWDFEEYADNVSVG